jgi:5-oxopent-3-ene-1,2,5-tricarboxylate decarboxylase/2-hydroxyhepta-2,4-diene-1,7-dioate isomerase
VTTAGALSHVAGFVLVVDLSVPHASFYRPSVRFKARDRSCIFGTPVPAAGSSFDADAARLRVSIDGDLVQDVTLAGMRRPAAQLIADVSDFMTLQPGDVLLLGVRHGAPVARGGQRFEVACDGLGRIEGRVAVEAEVAA